MRLSGERFVVGKNRKIGAVFVVVLFLLLASGAAIYTQRQAIYDQLYSWKLIPRPERLTELYFTDHQKLPTNYQPEQQQSVRFTVRNQEHRATSYRYTITQQDDSEQGGHQLDTGEFRLDHGQTQNVSTPITLKDMGAHSRLLVTITFDGIAFGDDDPTPQTQSIHYWLTHDGTPE